MAFDMANFVKSGKAAEIANIGVARAVERARLLGLLTYGPVANDLAAQSRWSKFKSCELLNNLQPLLVIENLQKSNKI